MPSIAIIGTGFIGGTVARLAVASGYHVRLANSRGPDTLAELVAELGPLAEAAPIGAVATGADFVLVSVPVGAYAALAGAGLDGRTIIDTGNYSPERDGRIEPLQGGLSTAEYLEQAVGAAAVVKAFNTIYYRHLAVLGRPSGAPDRSTLPIVGDDDAAKVAVIGLLDDLGYDALDVGVLAEEWRIMPGRPSYGYPYVSVPSGDFLAQEPTPASRADVTAAVAAPR